MFRRTFPESCPAPAGIGSPPVMRAPHTLRSLANSYAAPRIHRVGRGRRLTQSCASNELSAVSIAAPRARELALLTVVSK